MVRGLEMVARVRIMLTLAFAEVTGLTIVTKAKYLGGRNG